MAPLRRVLALVILAIALSISIGKAHGHPMPDSRVGIAIHDDRVVLQLALPSDRLAMAMIQAGVVADPGPGFKTFPKLTDAAITRYVVANLALSGPAGSPWPLRVTGITRPLAGQRDVVVAAEAATPPAARRKPFVLHYGVVIRHVVPDVAIVTLDQDWRAGILPARAELLGSLGSDQRALRITPHAPDRAGALAGMVRLGAWHILEGADHLAFLLALMLTVGLTASGGRWQVAAGKGQTLRDTVWRVSAFTLGHTLALLATSLGWLPEAGRTVEVVIALSVGVTAANALVPLFARREGFVAMGFGLVHGMAFASTIRSMSLSVGDTVSATLAFNIGIEIVQIGLVLLVLPALLLLRRTRWESPVRSTLAALAMLAAAYWMVARLIG
jgi:hypothetical protein